MEVRRRQRCGRAVEAVAQRDQLLTALEAAGLTFVLAAANIPTRRISWLLILEMAAPVLLLSALDTYHIAQLAPLLATCILFSVLLSLVLWILRR